MTLAYTNLQLLPHSLTIETILEYALARTEAGLRLAVCAPTESAFLQSFEGGCSELGSQTLLICPLSPINAAALRTQLAWLQPRPLGLKTSAGMGDRIGLATPGHVRAVRATGSLVSPIFAQQSIREMTRTERTPQQVMDDATWGIFQEGWHGGVGADADHLKTPADIDACLAAGYSFYTIDPGEYVDNRAEDAGMDTLRELAERLPAQIQPRASGLSGGLFNIEGLKVYFDEFTLTKAAVKYGRAIEQVAIMYHHLAGAAGQQAFELEVSVDETEQPTSHAEHIYIASELKRLGVRWVSLAPRYVGSFEKGVDYIGSIPAFQHDFAGHAAIARHFGPYKLSLHSGSDKFSIYPIAARLTEGLVHLKTAGTSYLEALRTVAAVDVDLFREIYLFARERYETDKASYHVSADLSRAPLPEEVPDCTTLLDQFDARQILHIAFGSVLTGRTTNGKFRFRDRFLSVLGENSDAYAENLEKHFTRHLKPFVESRD
jgi:tagaturonate epimerase